MSRPGGESDKLGNHFEAVWTVDAALDVLAGRFEAITVEAFGDESVGVEFHLTKSDGTLQFHSLKRQKQRGDWSIADLCHDRAGTGRTILGDLFEKLKKHAGAELRFVSGTGANELAELCERATTPTHLPEFKTALSVALQERFDKYVVHLCDNNADSALQALKRLEIITRRHNDLISTVERRVDELFYRKDRSDLNPGDVRRLIADFIVLNLGPPIGAGRLRQLLDSNGIGFRDWKTDKGVTDAVAALNKRFLSVVEMELINRAQIARDVVEKIISTLSDPASRGVLLVAPGGLGKSCVLAQSVSKLVAAGTPHLCLRMDAIQPCSTARQLGIQLDLATSPAVVLAGLADNSPSVLIVDQLDAMSLVSGRNPQMWEVFQELCEQVRSYPNMRLILACRDFDLKHDHRLRTLGESHSGFTVLRLDKLAKPDVRASLESAGYGSITLDDRQLQILSVPFQLLLFLQGNPPQEFTSVGQLYDRYWERKRQSVRDRLNREPRWNEVIDTLTQWMSEHQVLFAPQVVTDIWPDDARAMASAHVLIETENQRQYRFFHESFFDYAYARRFCASGQRLLEFLETTEQHLFRRAQVRQILAFRRENQFDQYIADIRDVLNSPKVRFHLKRMIASEFGRLQDPRPDEWAIIEPLLFEGELSRYLCGAIRDHVGWFDFLDSLHVFENWLASNEARLNNAAVWFLESRGLHESRSARVAQLIAPYAESEDAEWRTGVMRIMSWGQAHKSAEMTAIYLSMISRGVYGDYKTGVVGSDFWSQHYEAEKEAPSFIIDVLSAWFDRVVVEYDDGEAPNFLDKCPQNHSHNGASIVGQAAADKPQYFVETMLPRVAETVRKTEILRRGEALNRAWPFLTNHGEPYDINDAILLSLRRSLQYLAVHNVEEFRKHAATISSFPHETFTYLLLQSWSENPQEFADECAKYLIADQRRLNVGFGMWFGGGSGTGESAISRIAIRAISPHCSAELYEQLESKIIGYCDQYERETPSQRGYAELLVLRSLDQSRISQKTRLRIEELERKFPRASDAIVEEDKTELMTATGSPIPPDKAQLMNDDQWVSAMRKYKPSSYRPGGGATELSHLLAEFARKDRSRFAALALKMPDDIDPLYFSAILDGMCGRYANLDKDRKEADRKTFDNTPTELFLNVIDRLHALPLRPCGSAVCSCVEMLAKRELPQRVLEVISYYAIADHDPVEDTWKEQGGDPHHQGINCVRGQAAEAIGALLFADHARLADLQPVLFALANDPTVCVRTCAIRAFSPLLNSSRDLAVELLLQACGSCEDLWGTHPFEHFIHYAVFTHYGQLRELLQSALKSTNEKAVDNASTQIVRAELDGIDVGDDAAVIRRGTEAMRKAAADVYARNLGSKFVGDTCAEHLKEFFHDDSSSVRDEVSSAFFRLSGPRLLELREFIAQFIESKCFQNETYRLLHALEESNVQLPEIVGRAAERVLEFLGEEGTSIAHHGSMIAHTISTLVIRQYEQTTHSAVKKQCLDLIDQMERVGYLGLSEELGKIDR